MTFSTPTNLVPAQGAALSNASEVPEVASFNVKAGLAQMLKGGVIMDVINVEQALIAEAAGACAVMALERVPADIRKNGGVARMSDPRMIREIINAVSIPVMAKVRIGHIVEAQIIESLGVDYIDESEVLTPADEANHINKHDYKAVTHYKDPKVLAEVSEDLGEAMVGINISELPEEQRYSSRGCQNSQALPSREAKTTGTTSVLDDQYQAYFHILEEERRAAERTYSRVVYEPDLGLFRISVNRGNHFVSMGHTLRGQIYLYPEEALFLVDRGSLLAEHRGVDMTVQQMWSVYLQQAEERQQQEFVGAARAMDLYVTYAYLKRLGFVVTRSGTYHNAEEGIQGDMQAADQMQIVAPGPWTDLWSTVAAMWRRRTRSLFHALGLWFAPWSRLLSSGLDRPLVSNNDQLTYDQILEKIQIIPSIRLASVTDTSQPKKAKVDFEVYKPAGAFKKRQPGTPDYRVVVVEAGAPLPALEDFADYFQGQVDPATQESLETVTATASAPPQPTSGSGKGKKVKAPDWPKILFAVVDGGQVTFLNMCNIKATP
ncbi:Pyridoxal 5'-phosphate synthase subunit snz1 [Podila clonocystis]|nr:Pyridoxal 5'-phosphate synthase subunit snz1 [Podila clonocystis]